MMTTPTSVRVAIAATHPIQYQAPLWRMLASQPGLDVHVFFGSDLSMRGYRDRDFGVNVKWDVPLTAGYEHTFLSKDPDLQRISFRNPRATGIAKALRRFGPDVVLLNAYNGLFWVDCLAAARVLGVPIVMRHEASDVAMVRSRFKGMMRDGLLRLLYSQIAGFAAIGVEARRHLLRLGVPDIRIGRAPYCVDTEQIEQQVLKWVPQRNEIRSALRMAPLDFVVLFSGKLIEKKQPLIIPEAVRMLPEALRARMHLIVMGDGEKRTTMENAARNVFGARLHMPGFVNQSEIGRWYSAADCLILPSRKGAGETWGLVVNESMQFGLIPVVSDGVGCHPDLIDNATGCVFPSESAEKLAAVLAYLDAEPTTRREARAEACRQKIASFSVRAAADGLSAVLLRVALSRRTGA